MEHYLSEFDFRYNERIALGVSNEERATKSLKGILLCGGDYPIKVVLSQVHDCI